MSRSADPSSKPSRSTERRPNSDPDKPKKRTPSKYKFHSDYLTQVVDDEPKKETPRKEKKKDSKRQSRLDKVEALQHPQLHNDAFWESQYGLVNYRKKYPECFDVEEFENFYEWMADPSSTGPASRSLFKATGSDRLVIERPRSSNSASRKKSTSKRSSSKRRKSDSGR